MATVGSVTASPSTVAPSGGTSTITAVLNNADIAANVTVTVDGGSGSAVVTIHEPLSYSTTPSSTRGVVTATATGGTLSNGSLVDNGNGTSTLTLTFTAS